MTSTLSDAREHRLGFAVKVLSDGGLPSHDARRWSSGPHLSQSLHYLRTILEYLDRADIRMYRLPSALAPYASHPELTQFHGQLDECASDLAQVGELVQRYAIRLSSHPGQYTVLNSEDLDVRAAAIAELEVQAAILDGLGAGAEAVVVLHVGGARGGVAPAFDRFLAGFERLSERARARLVIENDDRSFGLADVLVLAERTGVPVVWDIHHHHCYDPAGIPEAEALAGALRTWPKGIRPKIHFSSPRLDVEEKRVRSGGRTVRRLVLPQLRAHADLVDPIAFERFLREVPSGGNFDVMLEAKAKDLALLRLRSQLAERGLDSEAGQVLVPRISDDARARGLAR